LIKTSPLKYLYESISLIILSFVKQIRCIGFAFSAKMGGNSRQYGKIAAYVKTHLQNMPFLEHKVSNNQFLVLKLLSLLQLIFLL
jgi:hypothetical protein